MCGKVLIVQDATESYVYLIDQTPSVNCFFFTAELGDYDPEVHTAYFISEFRFVPDQTENFELAVIDAYKSCRCVNFLLIMLRLHLMFGHWMKFGHCPPNLIPVAHLSTVPL